MTIDTERLFFLLACLITNGVGAFYMWGAIQQHRAYAAQAMKLKPSRLTEIVVMGPLRNLWLIFFFQIAFIVLVFFTLIFNSSRGITIGFMSTITIVIGMSLAMDYVAIVQVREQKEVNELARKKTEGDE